MAYWKFDIHNIVIFACLCSVGMILLKHCSYVLYSFIFIDIFPVLHSTNDILLLRSLCILKVIASVMINLLVPTMFCFLIAVFVCILSRIKRSCFNCGGNHDLSACNERRDMQRIGENRRQFQQRKLSAGNISQAKQARCDILFCLSSDNSSLLYESCDATLLQLKLL